MPWKARRLRRCCSRCWRCWLHRRTWWWRESTPVSGTIGAVLEAAGAGLRALAISQQIALEQHLARSAQADYSAAAHFTGLFAGKMLAGWTLTDVDAVKVDVPAGASAETPWKVTRISWSRYFKPLRPPRTDPGMPAQIPYGIDFDPAHEPADTDAYAVCVEGKVAVSPISLDLTSRIDLDALDRSLRDGTEPG
jgi:5'-nucleotidase